MKARRGELAPARALGDVAAQHDQVGRLGGGQVQRGLDHGLRSVPKCVSENAGYGSCRCGVGVLLARRHQRQRVLGHLELQRVFIQEFRRPSRPSRGDGRDAHDQRSNAKLTTCSASPSRLNRPRNTAHTRPACPPDAPPWRSGVAGPARRPGSHVLELQLVVAHDQRRRAQIAARPSCSSCRQLARARISVTSPDHNATSRLRPNFCLKASRSSSNCGYRPRLALTRNGLSLSSPTCTGRTCPRSSRAGRPRFPGKCRSAGRNN